MSSMQMFQATLMLVGALWIMVIGMAMIVRGPRGVASVNRWLFTTVGHGLRWTFATTFVAIRRVVGGTLIVLGEIIRGR